MSHLDIDEAGISTPDRKTERDAGSDESGDVHAGHKINARQVRNITINIGTGKRTGCQPPSTDK